MSDILADFKNRQLEWTLKLSTECPLHYVKQQVAQGELEFLFCIEIPWPLLRLFLDSPSVKATYNDFLNSYSFRERPSIFFSPSYKRSIVLKLCRTL